MVAVFGETICFTTALLALAFGFTNFRFQCRILITASFTDEVVRALHHYYLKYALTLRVIMTGNHSRSFL
jgi:hypothetical protein